MIKEHECRNKPEFSYSICKYYVSGKKKKKGIYLNEELAIAHNCIGVEKCFALASLFRHFTGFTS